MLATPPLWASSDLEPLFLRPKVHGEWFDNNAITLDIEGISESEGISGYFFMIVPMMKHLHIRTCLLIFNNCKTNTIGTEFNNTFGKS